MPHMNRALNTSSGVQHNSTATSSPHHHNPYLHSYHQLNTNALGAGGAFFPGAQSLLAKGGG
eukprot:CAMPEP_0179442576 /NCGR_PEP_ID=MMETSP0799-20121207/26086_1 /TAXON_ID=46947 /ORGANISM="Geminigera cryophila, Strain CCMP2564" /LENGTH=61 /DNA_ID=CAMNT_0021227885 /DNA_START=55 /DNA_END=237 /DNA_ORIENTATION=+